MTHRKTCLVSNERADISYLQARLDEVFCSCEDECKHKWIECCGCDNCEAYKCINCHEEVRKLLKIK